MVAPIVSPDAAMPLGGAQAMLADLAAGLVGKGHDVSLLAADGSDLQGLAVPRLGIDPTALQPLGPANAPRLDRAAQASAFWSVRAWLQAHETTVVHAHAYDAPAFEVLAGLRAPVVHTLHLPPSTDHDVVDAVRSAAASASMVAVSQAMAARWCERGVRAAAVIPNGVDLERVPFGPAHRGYVLWAGRITPEKGPDVAVRVARKLGVPLVLAGAAYDREYFERVVAPSVAVTPDTPAGFAEGAAAVYVGPLARRALYELMAGAAVTLMPARWDEPFGLVAIEAQAAGSPVVAFARGGLPEVVRDGVTGFLVPPDDEEAFVEASRSAFRLDRGACRAWIEERFSARRMLLAYIDLYARIAGSHPRYRP